MAPLSVATYPAVCGKVMEAPPASAMSDSPDKTLCTARWMATSEVEQPVPSDMLGPRRFSL
ncbi:Uncharacterised protein [Mycobacteroides abscessus subsp. massiliense]|nr:Uncharacterised protein [Mycobacteroides abscessus subsp. massiliense]